MSEELIAKFMAKMCEPFSNPENKILQSGPVILNVELSMMPKRAYLENDYLRDEALPALQKILNDNFKMTSDHVKFYCR
jgi:hypothetical protein